MANGSCPRGGMRQKLFGESFSNKELCSFFSFYGKEDGKKEMIKRETATFRKGFGEGDLENLRIILLFIILKQIWAHYLTTQLFILPFVGPEAFLSRFDED